MQCIITILASLHEMDARSFYGTRRATEVITIAETSDADKNNKNVVNTVVLLPIDSNSGRKMTEDVISDTEEMEADKLVLLAIFIISRCFTHLFKWASSGQCFLTTYNV